MIILGLSGAVGHDASAAIIVDGKIIAAAEEERFIRDKHAKNKFPYEAAKYCMEVAGVRPDQVEVVAFPYAEIPLSTNARWHYAKRHWYAPDSAAIATRRCN
jgi:carbamoyltransferase